MAPGQRMGRDTRVDVRHLSVWTALERCFTPLGVPSRCSWAVSCAITSIGPRAQSLVRGGSSGSLHNVHEGCRPWPARRLMNRIWARKGVSWPSGPRLFWFYHNLGWVVLSARGPSAKGRTNANPTGWLGADPPRGCGAAASPLAERSIREWLARDRHGWPEVGQHRPTNALHPPYLVL